MKGIPPGARRHRESSRRLCIETLLKHLPVRIADRFVGGPITPDFDTAKYTGGDKRAVRAARVVNLGPSRTIFGGATRHMLPSKLHISRLRE
jgi:hypothetical protein